MSKEFVSINLDGVPEKYRNYIRVRNGNIARRIAGFMQASYVGLSDGQSIDNYLVPAQPLTRDSARKFGVVDVGDLYGSVFDYREQTGKSILHPTLFRTARTPDYYSHEFAEDVDSCGVVLPGYSVFELAHAVAAFDQLQYRHGDVRVKATNESDGNGQVTIKEREQLLRYLCAEYDESRIQREGVVLEPSLTDLKTISVGEVVVAGQGYGFVAHQIDRVRSNGTNEYMGADVVVVKGDIKSLHKVMTEQSDRDAISLAYRFHSKYSHFNPIISRVSYDVLSGSDSRGNFQIGITDITARLGGTCPAIMEAIALMKKKGISFARSQVRLNYGIRPNEMPVIESYESGAQVYLDHDVVSGITGLRITASARALA